MVLTVFGATGQVGKRIVQYALAKGHTVRAFGRNVTDLIDEDIREDQLVAIKGSVFNAEEVFDAISGSDGVLSALGGAADGIDKTRSLGIKIIAEQMEKAGVRKIVALGGSGVLTAADGKFIIEQPSYPKQYLPVGREHLQAFLNLQSSNLDWTFVCSYDIRDEDATERYVTNDNYPPTPNNHYITAGDLAHFMVDEVENPKHVRQRVGISAV